MAQQTAVDELYNDLFPKKLDGFSDEEWSKIDKAFEQANKKFQQQIEDAYNKGTINGIDYPESKLALTGEKYYTQTYGK